MTWTRARFIKTGILASIGILLVDGLWFEKFFIETNEFFMGKSTLDNTDIKVVQVSDLHIKTLNAQLIRLTKKLNEIQPDLILLTGDAIDDPKKLPVLNEFLKLINAGVKKVAILGNWEYWGSVDLKKLADLYLDNNCDLLVNKTSQYSFRQKNISITGVDDYVGGQADIDLALKDFKKSDYHIILNHCPEYSDIIQEKISKDIPVDVILSGHTHGGQINLFGLVPFKPQGSGKYLKGWYKDSGMNFYVSKGVGTSILPIRFMARSEVAVFNLRT
jgi:predicted MPP superfamily phosphohydrolase